MENWLKHVKENEDTFKFWIENHTQLQASNDIFAPIIPEFQKAFPQTNVYSCPNCIIDMLMWARIQLKKTEQGTPRSKKE